MPLTKDLLHVVLQFLNEEKYTETAHMLEKESALYFDMKYIEDLVMAGKFDEAESYLLGFINLEDNEYSAKIFLEIRKQKYLEALDGKDKFKAMKILREDLNVFKNMGYLSPEDYTEMIELVTLDNFRRNKKLQHYKDTETQRIAMFKEIEPIVQSNPTIGPKLMLPSISSRRLRTLINQSLHMQHITCKAPQPNPDMRTLFVDHTCEPSTRALRTPRVNNYLMRPIQTSSLPSAMNARFQPQVGSAAGTLSKWIPSPPVQHGTVTSRAAALLPHPNAGALLQLQSGHVDEAPLSNLVSPANTIGSPPWEADTYPSIIAARPHEPNHISVGLTDGGVYVTEPKEKSDNGAPSSDHEFPPRLWNSTPQLMETKAAPLSNLVSPPNTIGSPPWEADTYPSIIAAHPHEPNHISVGLTDGGVYVTEPKEKSDNGAPSSDHEFPPR